MIAAEIYRDRNQMSTQTKQREKILGMKNVLGVCPKQLEMIQMIKRKSEIVSDLIKLVDQTGES